MENPPVIVINFGGWAGSPWPAEGTRTGFVWVVISIESIISLYPLQCSVFYSVIYRLTDRITRENYQFHDEHMSRFELERKMRSKKKKKYYERPKLSRRESA
ncbi:hypothetical protein AVEN_262284-1, partial [Araneus ventricosus]